MVQKPYVGVTGPANITESKGISQEFVQAGFSPDFFYAPMIGFLVSQKTLNGQPVQNRRYPQIEDLPEMLQAIDPGILSMIHYNSRDLHTLSDQVTRIFSDLYNSGLCRAVQLNIPWPNIPQVRKIKDKHPEMKIVLQASHNAMDGLDSLEITQRVRSYGDSLDYVLIDPSGGRGLPFDSNSSVAIYEQVRKAELNITVGFAGGFTGDNVSPRLKELTQRLSAHGFSPEFCIDAEGGLRDKLSDAYGDDLLDMEKVRAYIRSAYQELAKKSEK